MDRAAKRVTMKCTAVPLANRFCTTTLPTELGDFQRYPTDPTDSDLISLLFDTPWATWDAGPNAECCLEVIVDAERSTVGTAVRPFNISREHPCLIIKPDAATTGRIMSTFFNDLTRDASVNWVDWCDLDIPEEWF
jgi:hypothetical protein